MRGESYELIQLATTVEPAGEVASSISGDGRPRYSAPEARMQPSSQCVTRRFSPPVPSVVHGIVLEALGSLAVEDLAAEPDELFALRKALLVLIYLAERPGDSAAERRRFVRFLLADFPPLARQFDADDIHPFIGPHPARRWLADDPARLFIRHELVDCLFEEARRLLR